MDRAPDKIGIDIRSLKFYRTPAGRKLPPYTIEVTERQYELALEIAGMDMSRAEKQITIKTWVL